MMLVPRFHYIEAPHSLLEEARDTYKKVIEIDPRNVPAMTLLGSVYQLMDDPDSAIVKYHEVRSPSPATSWD